MTDFEIQESALALQAGGWTGDDEEQFLEDNATRPEDEQTSAADVARIFEEIRRLETLDRVQLVEMPFDKSFDGGFSLCHATGYAVRFPGESCWVYEYEGPDGTLLYSS